MLMSSGTEASVITSSPSSACRRSTTFRFSVGVVETFSTQTSPSTQIASEATLFVTVTVYVLVPDCPVSSSHEAGETDFSIVHRNVFVQWASAVLYAEIGDVAFATGAITPARTAVHTTSHSLLRTLIREPLSGSMAFGCRARARVRPHPRASLPFGSPRSLVDIARAGACQAGPPARGG